MKLLDEKLIGCETILNRICFLGDEILPGGQDVPKQKKRHNWSRHERFWRRTHFL